MYLGALSSIFISRSLDDAAARMRELGLQFIEIGAGGYFPKNHCHPAQLLSKPSALEKFQRTLSDAELAISAFALHGEPLHPDPEIACAYDRDFRAACAL